MCLPATLFTLKNCYKNLHMLVKTKLWNIKITEAKNFKLQISVLIKLYDGLKASSSLQSTFPDKLIHLMFINKSLVDITTVLVQSPDNSTKVPTIIMPPDIQNKKLNKPVSSITVTKKQVNVLSS